MPVGSRVKLSALSFLFSSFLLLSFFLFLSFFFLSSFFLLFYFFLSNFLFFLSVFLPFFFLSFSFSFFLSFFFLSFFLSSFLSFLQCYSQTWKICSLTSVYFLWCIGVNTISQLKGVHRLRTFEIWVLRGIFGLKAEKVTPGCKSWTANSHKIRDLHSLLLGLSRQRRMVWARCVARVGEMGYTYS